MKRFCSVLLTLFLLVSIVPESSGDAVDIESFLQVNDSVNKYLSCSASYNLSEPISVVTEFSQPETTYWKERPAGYEIPSSRGGTVSVSDGVRIWTETSTGSVYTIYNLIPGITYHYRSCDASGAVLAESDVIAEGNLRMIYSSTPIRNVRDLGGWNADGGTVQYNKLFRGASPNAINQRDQKLFQEWLNIQTHIDLRVPDQTGLNGITPMAAGTKYVNIDMRYQAFQTTEVNLSRYTVLLNTVIDSVTAGKGVYFHCAAGADRTGQAAFLLLGLLGVSPLDLARDYELTSFSPYERLWTGTAFQTMLRQMSEFKGETFQDKCAAFAQLAGVSLDRINAFRHAMIDGTPSDLKPYEPRNGLYWDSGNLYYYENDEISGNGLMVLDGYYYYVKPTDQTLVYDGEFEVTVSNGLMPQGTYQFDSQGRMIIPPPCSHLNTVVNDKKEPTCTEAGYSGDKVCADCGELLDRGSTIAPLGHSTALRSAKDASCTEAGFTGDEVCKVCGKTITLGTVIPARGHSWGSWTIVTPATEFSAGLETHTCSVCHETESRAIPVLTHIHHLEAVSKIEPSCETVGSEAHWKCTGCGRLFSDAEGKNEISAPVVIPAKGHDAELKNIREASCTEVGYTGDEICKNCGKTIQSGDEIAPLGHDWDSGVVTKTASCTESGVMTYTCRRDAAHQRTEEILPLGHTLVKHDAKVPNETESGSIAYWECSVCGRLFGDAAGNREIKTEDTILTPVRCPSEAFTDVDRTAKSWYHEAVDWAVANHITTGTSAVTFSPNAECTREQMVTFLWRALGEPKANRTSCPFTDVKAGDYSRNAILWAYENGIVKGTAADKFSPKAPVTREQVVTILWRLAHEPAAEGGMPFPDVKPGYAFDAIRWAAEEGVAAGYEDGTFRPTRAVTRAEIVTLLRRALDS